MEANSFAERGNDRYYGGSAPHTRPASAASTQSGSSMPFEGSRRPSTQLEGSIGFEAHRGPASLASVQGLRLMHRDTILQSHEAPVNTASDPSIKPPPRTSTFMVQTAEGAYNLSPERRLKIETKGDLIPAF